MFATFFCVYFVYDSYTTNNWLLVIYLAELSSLCYVFSNVTLP